MNFTDFVSYPGIVKNPLGTGGFTRIDMSANTNVAKFS
jgi:hypothetical protein